jgi:hypothetical protein
MLRGREPDCRASVTFSSDATRLASKWIDSSIRVWDRNSGRCLHTIKLGLLILNASFDESGQFLLTNIGRIAIPASSDLEGNEAAPTAQFPLFHGVGLSLNKRWVTYNSANVLWLAPEYRPHRSVISGNSVSGAAGRKLCIFTMFPEYLG